MVKVSLFHASYERKRPFEELNLEVAPNIGDTITIVTDDGDGGDCLFSYEVLERHFVAIPHSERYNEGSWIYLIVENTDTLSFGTGYYF